METRKKLVALKSAEFRKLQGQEKCLRESFECKVQQTSKLINDNEI